MTVQIECDWCQEEYETYEYKITNNNFCSKQCYLDFQKKDNVELTCSWCGSTKTVPQSHPSARNSSNDEYEIMNNFCDKECESNFKSTHWTGEDHPNWNGGNVESICEECGDVYTVKPSELDETRFCSQGCLAEHQSVDLIDLNCDMCGDHIERKPHQIRGDSTFCSDKCFSGWLSDEQSGSGNPQWKGGSPDYYGENWPKERRRALNRDEYSCQVCEMARNEHYAQFETDLHVHHKLPIRTFNEPEDANYPENLVTVCQTHHNEIESKDVVPHNSVRAPSRSKFVLYR